MKFRAVLHDTDSGGAKVESILFDTKEQAVNAGEEGLKLYGGSHYSIEETNE
jgi:hypothetical protein